jgi:hypothetical protein
VGPGAGEVGAGPLFPPEPQSDTRIFEDLRKERKRFQRGALTKVGL